MTVTNYWDQLERLTGTKFPDGSTTSNIYSALDITATKDRLGYWTYFGYNSVRQKIAETNANNEVIRYTNNAAGDLLSLTDGKNQTTKWNYDAYGRVTNKLDQAGAEILRYTYDADSRLSNRWSVAKGTTIYGYDAVGNLTTINYPQSTDVSFTYDALNRASNMVDAVGTTIYGYAAGGQLWTEDGPWSSDTVTNSYTSRLRTSLSLAQPTGAWTNGFGYDAAKRLTNVTSQAGSFGYTLGGANSASPLPKKVLLPNTSYITNTYDNVARLTGTWLKNSTNGTLDSSTYVYNLGHQRTNLTRTDGSSYAFSYDPIGQLKVANGSVNAEDRGYQYDAAWNLKYLTNNGSLNIFGVDGLNQLSFSPQANATYDDNGNLVSLDDGSQATRLCYDDENRLVRVIYIMGDSWPEGECDAQPQGSGYDWRVDFVYDGVGRLRAKIDYPPEWASTGNLWSWDTAWEVDYIYDGFRVIQERTSGSPSVSYTRGSDLSGSLEGAGGIGGLLARTTHLLLPSTNAHLFYHADGNGNITYLVNNGQGLAASYRYDPYGNTLSQSGAWAADNVYRFSSKEIHGYSGLYYYGYRWYAPNLQRWVNRDPIGERGGRNLYNYAQNTPVQFTDAFGLFTWDSSCSETEKSAIKDRLAKACKKAKDSDCFNKCKISEKGAKAMEKACNSKDGEGPPVKCERTHQRCQTTSRGTGCGWTDPRGDRTIHVCMNQPASECPGGPGCTLFHELAHREGGVGPDDVVLNPDERAYDLEKCAGCR